MGLLNNIFNKWRGVKNVVTMPDWWRDAKLSGIITPESAMGVPMVWAAVNYLARTVSTLPIQVFEKTADGSRKQVTSQLSEILKTEPNPFMSTRDLLFSLMWNWSLYGICYYQVIKDGAGRLKYIFPIENKRVSPYRYNDCSPITYKVDGIEGLEVYSILNGTSDGICGRAFTKYGNRSVQLAIALDENSVQFFENHSKPGLVIVVPRLLKEEAYNRLKNSWTVTGDSAYKTKILEQGATLETINYNARDSQLTEQKASVNEEIARYFGIPQHKLGLLGNATFSNIEQQAIETVTDVIRPIVVAFEQSLNRHLFPKGSRLFVEFNLEGLLRGDMESRMRAYVSGINNGILNANEARRKENLEPYEGGGDFLRPLNMGTVKPNGEIVNPNQTQSNESQNETQEDTVIDQT